MRSRRGVAPALAAFAVVLVAGPTLAKPTPVERCTAAKRRVAGELGRTRFLCLAKAPLMGTVDFDCLNRANGAFQRAFAAADAKGPCAGAVDATLEAVLLCQSSVSFTLTGTGRCPASKHKAAGRNFGRTLRCGADAVTAPETFAACDTASDARMTRAFARADAQGPCAGDAMASEAAFDACIGNLLASLMPVPGTTTSTTTPGPTTSTTTPGSTSTTLVSTTSTAPVSTTSTTLGPCAHSPCVEGGPLDAGCGPCVGSVCTLLPECCFTAWDFTCVEAVATVCTGVCF